MPFAWMPKTSFNGRFPGEAAWDFSPFVLNL